MKNIGDHEKSIYRKQCFLLDLYDASRLFVHITTADISGELHSENCSTRLETVQSNDIIPIGYGFYAHDNQSQETHQIINSESYFKHYSILFMACALSKQ